MQAKRIIVVGAGVAGLVAASELAAAGHRVSVLEAHGHAGGKMRQVAVGGRPIDAGPTVFTMRWVFDELLADLGAPALDDLVTLTPLDVLARHAWSGGDRLDLYPDLERSADAVGRLAGSREAAGYRAFAEDGRKLLALLERPFMTAPRPSLPGLLARTGLAWMLNIGNVQPYATLAQQLARYFRDPRLIQLFGRYATYCGSSPFEAPATLMLIAEVERQGVWSVEGGMGRLAAGLADVARAQGATLRFDAPVREILVRHGHAHGVRLASGEEYDADAIVANADAAALAGGLLGSGVSGAAPGHAARPRSLSAMAFAAVARADGFPLTRHNVFFSDDYPAEFADLFTRRRLPADPTVYLCAMDRLHPPGMDDAGAASPAARERMLLLVNAPATGDRHPFDAEETRRCEESLTTRLARCGLTLSLAPERLAVTTPRDFDRLFPGRGGALYGAATHGVMASFRRPGSVTPIPGLFLAGGSVHPGAGVPMAAISGRLAARSVLTSLASTRTSVPAATAGGMSTG